MLLPRTLVSDTRPTRRLLHGTVVHGLYSVARKEHIHKSLHQWRKKMKPRTRAKRLYFFAPSAIHPHLLLTFPYSTYLRLPLPTLLRLEGLSKAALLRIAFSDYRAGNMGARANLPRALNSCVHSTSRCLLRIRKTKQAAMKKHDFPENQQSTFMEWKSTHRRMAGDAETGRRSRNLARRAWLDEQGQQATS